MDVTTYVLEMDMSLACNVIDNILNVLLSAATYEVLLRCTMLEIDKKYLI